MDNNTKIRKQLHNINNCMSIIIGNLDMLALEELKEEVSERLKDMSKASVRIAEDVQVIYKIIES